MAVPFRNVSKGRKGKRRSHHALKAPTLTVCPNCGKKILPHRICKFCGYYKKQERITK